MSCLDKLIRGFIGGFILLVIACGLMSWMFPGKSTSTNYTNTTPTSRPPVAPSTPAEPTLTEQPTESESNPVDDQTRLVNAEYERQLAAFELLNSPYQQAIASCQSNRDRIKELEKDKVIHQATKPREPEWEDRTWYTLDKSHSTEGEFVSASETTVKIKRSNGKTVRVPIAKLIAGDSFYIENQRQAEAAFQSELTDWAHHQSELTEESKKLNSQVVLAAQSAPPTPSRDAIASKFAREKAEKEAEIERRRIASELAIAKAEQDAADAYANRPRMTMANFNRCRPGMSYQEVVAIVGKPSEVIQEIQIESIHHIMYMWKGGIIANANMTFENGKMIQKTQIGL